MQKVPITFFPKNQQATFGKGIESFRINSLRISLTNKCNYDCFFCHNEGDSKSWRNQVQGFSDALINVVRAGVELGIRKLTLTGGEPFLRKDIFEIINGISSTSNDIMLGITSNGFLLTPNKIRALAGKVHKINLNFQSARDDNFAEITGVKGLQKITSIIPLLQSAGIHVTLNFVFTSKNQDDIDYVLKYAQITGCDLKILELVRVFANEDDLPKGSYPDLIQRLTLQYGEGQYFIISPSEKIAYFDTIKGQRKLRFISSYCNSFDENVCATHGELRVSHRLELKHCVMPSIVGINVSHFAQEGDIESIKNSLNQINGSLGKCP